MSSPAVPFVVGLGGSTGASSVTDRLLLGALDRLTAMGARTRAFNGDELGALPIYGADGDDTLATPMVTAVRGADAVVIATPGYHGGMSGLVKNALDHLEALRDDEHPYLDGRAAGVIVAAAGWQAAGTTLDSVRSAIHALRGWPTPFGVTVNSSEQRPDAAGRFDATVGGALDILAGQIMQFCRWRLS